MQNPKDMDHAQGFGDRSQIIEGLLDADGIAQALAKIAAREVFHGEIQMFGQAAEVVDFRDGTVRDARNDLVFPVKPLAILTLARSAAATHHLEHDVAAHAFTAREKHRREVARRNLLHDRVARHGDRLRRRLDEAPCRRGQLRVFAAAQGLVHGREDRLAREAGNRQVIVGTALERPDRGPFVAPVGENDAVEPRAQLVSRCNMRDKPSVAPPSLPKSICSTTASGSCILDEPIYRCRLFRIDRGHARGRPMARDMVSQPLQPLLVAPDHQQDRSFCRNVGHSLTLAVYCLMSQFKRRRLKYMCVNSGKLKQKPANWGLNALNSPSPA